VKRLVRTSQGWVELDVDEISIAGFHVRVTVFGEGGWARAEETWNAKWPIDEKSFEMFLADIAAIPPDEAVRIAEESVREWRERGSETERRSEKRAVIAWLTTMFGLAALGAIALIAITVFLILRLT
jgi:hypothetical protein